MSEGQEIRTAIGAALRSRRAAAGMSLASLAERANLSAAHVSDVERGRKEISTDRLARACAALEVAPGELFAEVGMALGAAGQAGGQAAPGLRVARAAQQLSPQSLAAVAEFSAYLASKESAGHRGRIGFEF